MHPAWDDREDARPVVPAGAQRTRGLLRGGWRGWGSPPPPAGCSARGQVWVTLRCSPPIFPLSPRSSAPHPPPFFPVVK